MALGSKVTSSSTPSSTTSNDDLGYDDLLNKFFKVMCSLCGKARYQFEYLMTYKLDKVKHLDSLDRSNTIAQELDASKKELEVARASFTKDLEQLEVTGNLVNVELLKLREDNDQLQLAHNEVLRSINDPILFDDISCANNSQFVQASHVDKNKKGLDSVLAQQKVRTPNQGLGYNPRKNKTYVIPPKKDNFVLEEHKRNANGKKNVGLGKSTRGNPNYHFAGESNPSYLLCEGTNENLGLI
jgi:hypothetical protein